MLIVKKKQRGDTFLKHLERRRPAAGGTESFQWVGGSAVPAREFQLGEKQQQMHVSEPEHAEKKRNK